jgi:hypothetical protein
MHSAPQHNRKTEGNRRLGEEAKQHTGQIYSLRAKSQKQAQKRMQARLGEYVSLF